MQLLCPHTPLDLLGSGIYLPGPAISNREVLAIIRPDSTGDRLDHGAQSIFDMHGLRHRHWVAPPGQPADQTSAELAVRAGQSALLDAGLRAEEVAGLWVATSTPPSWTSATAAAVGAKLGIDGPCQDVRAGCSAGLFAMINASLAIGAGAGPQLIIGSETFSRVVPPSHAPSFISMADGAGAVVISAGSGELIATAQHTESRLNQLVGTRGPMPPTHQAIDADLYRLSGDPGALAEHMPRHYLRVLNAALQTAGLHANAMDALVVHQTHGPMVDGICDGLDLPRSKAVYTVQEHGNVGSAGWLVALHLARSRGRVRRDDHVLIGAVGGGISSAAAVWRI
ncbi:MAG: 3-oxoacyl-[acyl-carrier-protein] synthase-3 [Kiritimatiellia bacterium]|jgi:3-oxoacyl-[acyl-carrier-protein] synthase-3